MAEPKKRVRPRSALERARQLAAEQSERFARRERELNGLAVDYLMAGTALEKAREQVERRMEPLHRELAEAGQVALEARVGVVARMRALEAPEAEVAARLDISLGEVRRCMALARSWAADGGQVAAGDGGRPVPAGNTRAGGGGGAVGVPVAANGDGEQRAGVELVGEVGVGAGSAAAGDGLVGGPPGADGWVPDLGKAGVER